MDSQPRLLIFSKWESEMCPGSLWNSGCPKHALYAQPRQVFLPCILAQGPIRHMCEGHVTVASRLQCKATPHFLLNNSFSFQLLCKLLERYPCSRQVSWTCLYFSSMFSAFCLYVCVNMWFFICAKPSCHDHALSLGFLTMSHC